MSIIEQVAGTASESRHPEMPYDLAVGPEVGAHECHLISWALVAGKAWRSPSSRALIGKFGAMVMEDLLTCL
jgi:hypothetical protein